MDKFVWCAKPKEISVLCKGRSFYENFTQFLSYYAASVWRPFMPPHETELHSKQGWLNKVG